MMRPRGTASARRTPIGVGIIGFGFMGRAHTGAYAAHPDRCRIVGIADRSPPTQGVVGNIATSGPPLDLATIEHHSDAWALLADPRIELVSICTPTDTHVDLAMAALDAGKHVLVEKPVAATTDRVRLLRDRARASGCLCMPAMCLRFWPEWTLLAKTIRERPMGALRSLAIQRLGPAPDWNDAFYLDERRSGGMIADLHIHDTDFIVHTLGVPSRVRTSGHARHLTTAYCYDGAASRSAGPVHVTAEASWDLPPTAGFRMAYRAIFERGALEHDSRDGKRVLLHRGGTVSAIEPPELSPIDGYAGEIDALLGAIESGSQSPVTLDEALQAAEVLDMERASLGAEMV